MAFEIENGWYLAHYEEEPGVTEVTVPAGVTDIGDYAFQNCRTLTKITLPEGLTKIGFHAFFGCTALRKIDLPETLVHLQTAFPCCECLEEITIPSGVRELSPSCFLRCTSLKAIHISPDNPFYAEYDGAVYSKDLIRLCFAPEGKSSIRLAEGVQIIGFALYPCKKIREVTIPYSVILIHDAAFAPGCTLHFERPDGVMHIHLRQLWEHKDARLTLEIIHSNNLQECEEKFTQIKEPDYKTGIALFFLEHHPESEVFSAYVRRSARRIAKGYIAAKDADGLQRLLDRGFITRRNISDLTEYAAECGAQECMILLLDFKNEAGLYSKNRFAL